MKFLLFVLCLFSVAQAENPHFYDSDHVHYELYQTNDGPRYNWIFLPGGPGGDSSYLRSLIDTLELPGNVWLIDLPDNGKNAVAHVNYEEWLKIFPQVVKKFENPILVGHSFGGMFPLLFPELEECLKGFIILNSAPTQWLEAAAQYGKQFNLPDLSKEMAEFALHPSQETFNVALGACAPYYFSPDTLEAGRAFLATVHMHYPPSVWWIKKVTETGFSAAWIPQNVPTIIVGAKYDCICPYALFENDARFHRPNIKMHFIADAGHFPWLENPQAVQKIFKELISQL